MGGQQNIKKVKVSVRIFLVTRLGKSEWSESLPGRFVSLKWALC